MATAKPIVHALRTEVASLEPDWVNGNLRNYPKVSQLYPEKDGMVEGPIQQSDLLKPILMDAARFGLTYVFYKYYLPVPEINSDDDPFEQYKYKKTENPKKVIVIGAGLAGLIAAYELEQVGHEVQLVEMQTRLGGRIKTFGEKDGFAKHLYADAGAMRLPNEPDDENKTHFLTDFYISKFQLPVVPFNNSDDNAYLKFYNMDPMTIAEWNQDPKTNFDKYWPGWDSNIDQEKVQEKYGITIESIDKYYDLTTKVVTDQLRRKLFGKTAREAAEVWEKWIDNWSRFPLNGFMRSTPTIVCETLDEDYREAEMIEELGLFLPWSEEAITAYSVFGYTEQLDQCFVQYLRDQLGDWWSSDMHHIDGGMYKLSEKFAEVNENGWNTDVHLQERITFNVTVNEVEFTSLVSEPDINNRVLVKGYYTNSGAPFEIEGNAVICTVPLNIIRQIKFTNTPGTPPLHREFYKAIEDIWYGPSTKIMIQTRTRFWEKEEYNISGGFSKTNLPVGQVHYPTRIENPKSDRGILLCYLWKSEALLFGALNPQVAVNQAVNQLAQIHEEIKDEFEVGAVQAWYNDPAAQGAYVLLKPKQYDNVEHLMVNPWRNIYFAGEGISFAAGWIQGAFESGLRAAYQFYVRNEKLVAPTVSS